MNFDPQTYEKLGAFYLGREVEHPDVPILYDSRDLTTHAVCVGMTGSGKTGLCIALLEEALLDRVPAIVIDPKGDIGNLLLTFPELAPADFAPWLEDSSQAATVAARWRDGLQSWGQGPERIRRLRESGHVALYTPGSTSGRPVSILSSLNAPPPTTRADAEAFADRVSNTATSLLALLGGKEVDPLQDPEHVFLANLLRDAWEKGHSLDLAALIRGIQNPPFDRVGVMALDDVFGPRERSGLAMRLNNLLAAPSFAPWLEGADLDVDRMLFRDGKPQISIFSIAHLDDAERMFFVSLLVGRMLDWTRTQAGTGSLRALLYMDEIFGFLPPVANPPSKRPLLTMLKQARAFGVGLVLATQNPVDLDYKALSNTGTWFLGRLQTERDVDRVVDGLVGADDSLDRAWVQGTLAGLRGRQFLLHNVHERAPRVFETRWVMSYLRGPLTRADIRRLTQTSEAPAEDAPGAAPEPARSAPTAVPRRGAHLPVHLPGGSDETLLWRPMAYGAGRVVLDGEVTAYGFIRGLRGGLDFDWSDATSVLLDPEEFRDSDQGHHLDVDPVAEDPGTWKRWAAALQKHSMTAVTPVALSCPKLRLTMERGESPEVFRRRVDLAIREKRDEAVDKLRQRYQSRIERLEDQIRRAQETAARQQDQLRQAQLDAAVNVGEALWGMLGGRRKSVSTSRATRVVSKGREVDRAQQKVDELSASLYDLQAEMESALAQEAAKLGADAFPIVEKTLPVRAKDVEVSFCQLVWVPYWEGPDGRRRRAM